MTEPDPENIGDQVSLALLTTSSHLYGLDPLFFARCAISVKAANHGMNISFGRDMNQNEYAACVQAAACALVMATVDDDELSDSVDHAKVLTGQLEFSLLQERLAGEKGQS